MSHTRVTREDLLKIAEKYQYLRLGQLLKSLAKNDEYLKAARGLLIVAVKNNDFNLSSFPALLKQEEDADPSKENYEELIFVAEFYDCLQTKIGSSLPRCQMEDKELGVLRGVTQKVLREFVDRDFRHADFKSSIPTLTGLRVQFKTLIKEYAEYLETRWLTPDPKRDLFFRLIQVVDGMENYPHEAKVREALLIFVAMDILGECRVMDPNSKLYSLCLGVFKLQSPNELVFRYREDLLRHLIDFFNDGLLDGASSGKLSGQEINDIRQMIQGHIDLLDRNNRKNEQSNLHLVGNVTAMVTKEMAPTLGRYALSHVAVQAAGVTGFWAGPAIGTLFAASTYMANRWYGAMSAPESSALSKATLGLYSVLLKQLSKKTGTAIEDLARLVCGTPRDGHKQLHGIMTPEQEETFRDWVNTLLKLDHGLVLQSEQTCIRYIYGLQPGEYLEATTEKNAKKTLVMECKLTG